MKSKTTTKPWGKAEPYIMGAADKVNSAYDANAAGIQQGADQLRGLMSTVLNKYQAGDPNITAARGYNADVLAGKYLDQGNPYLQGIIDRTNNSVRNQTQASLGSRGLTNGSDYVKLIADRIANNETGLRYQDYGAERDRMGQAAALAPTFVGGENAMLDPVFAAYEAQQAPIRAAAGYGSSIGGLLGNYTTTKQKGSLGGLLAQLAGNAAQAYAMGG